MRGVESFMPGKQSESAEKIRYYIYGIVRKSHNASVQIPSSYELAEMFGTTRRVAQYELELLIAKGVLLAKHRVGTFTNPMSDFCWHSRMGESCPFVGITYGSGDFFSYSYAASLALAGLYREFAEANCSIHDLRLIGKSEESIFNDIRSIPMDALVWATKETFEPETIHVLNRLVSSGLPVVTFGGQFIDQISGVAVSCFNSIEKLKHIFQTEKRTRILMLSSVLNPQIRDLLEEGHYEFTFPVVSSIDGIFHEVELLLAGGYVPDVCFCEDGFILAVENLLKRYQIDCFEQCRLVSLFAFRTKLPFTGYVLLPDFETMAREAAQFVRQHLSEKTYSPKRALVEASLLRWNSSADGANRTTLL